MGMASLVNRNDSEDNNSNEVCEIENSTLWKITGMPRFSKKNLGITFRGCGLQTWNTKVSKNCLAFEYHSVFL